MHLFLNTRKLRASPSKERVRRFTEVNERNNGNNKGMEGKVRMGGGGCRMFGWFGNGWVAFGEKHMLKGRYFTNTDKG